MKIGILSGSARNGNNTLRVAKALQNHLEGSHVVDYQMYDLPSMNDGWLDLNSLSTFQADLVNTIEESDLLFVLTPEYNWFPSAEIVNTVHQLGGNAFKHIFDNMVVATIGVSAGRGGRMPAVQLGYVFNKIFNFFNLNSITSPKPFEAQEVVKCIDSEGNLLDNEVFNQGFKSFVEYSIKVAERWQLSE